MQPLPLFPPDRELWCLAEDEVQPFLIRISPKSYIYDLEARVLTRRMGCTVGTGPFRNLVRKDITLMKIDVDFLANRTEISSGLFRPNPNDEGVKVLDNTMEEIDEVWQTTPPKGTISVFVYRRNQ